MLESTIEEKIKVYAKKLGWVSYKFVSTANRGVPDQLFIKDGLTVYVEFKQKGKKATPLQVKVHKTMRDHGAKVFVVDSVECGKELFDSL